VVVAGGYRWGCHAIAVGGPALCSVEDVWVKRFEATTCTAGAVVYFPLEE
jgi:hypothetical protein